MPRKVGNGDQLGSNPIPNVGIDNINAPLLIDNVASDYIERTMNYHHGNLRRELLDRAAQVIARQGIENLSLRGLAQDLGVSHGAPARHFKDRHELLSALATEGLDKLADYVFAAAEAAGSDPLERYAAMGRALVRFSIEYPAYYQATRHPEVVAHAGPALNEAHQRRMQMIMDAARQAQAAGWLQGETVEDAVTFSLAAVRGVAALLNDPLFPHSAGDKDREQFIERMVRLIIDPGNPQTARNSPKSRRRKGAR
jgi:AcrR family transcriptional regulator